MKTKFVVSIIKESSLVEVIDERFAKETLIGIVQLKMNPFEQTIRSEIKIDKDKISLKNNRKWFNKYKILKLDHIKKFFLYDIAPEYILLYVSIDDFNGYIILKIDIASNMISFIEILKASPNYSQSTPFIEVNNDHDERRSNDHHDQRSNDHDRRSNDVTDSTNFGSAIKTEKTPITKEIHHDEETSLFNDLIIVSQIDDKSLESVDSANFSAEINSIKKGKIIVVDGDIVTYVNCNVKGVVVDDGPVSLYSKTYPSLYNRNSENGTNFYDSVESLSDSYNEEHNMF